MQTNLCFGFPRSSLTLEIQWKRNVRVFLGENVTSKVTSTANATCYRYEPGCDYSDGQERVNDALEVVTRTCHFVNPSEGQESASWTS